MAQVLHEFPSVPLPICAEVRIEKISGRWIFLDIKKTTFCCARHCEEGRVKLLLVCFWKTLRRVFWAQNSGNVTLSFSCSLQCIISLNMSVTSINAHIPISSHYHPISSYWFPMMSSRKHLWSCRCLQDQVCSVVTSLAKRVVSSKGFVELELSDLGLLDVASYIPFLHKRMGKPRDPFAHALQFRQRGNILASLRCKCKRWSFNFSDVKLVAANPRQAWRIWPSCLKRSVKRFPGNKIGPTKHHKFAKFPW